MNSICLNLNLLMIFISRLFSRGPNGKLILPKNIEQHINLIGLKLNERQMAALEKIGIESMVFTYNIYAELFDVSVTTSKRDLNDLVDKKLINSKKVKNIIIIIFDHADSFHID